MKWILVVILVVVLVVLFMLRGKKKTEVKK
jgi:cbb3-type cytochrome oxidase subunit 3